MNSIRDKPIHIGELTYNLRGASHYFERVVRLKAGIPKLKILGEEGNSSYEYNSDTLMIKDIQTVLNAKREMAVGVWLRNLKKLGVSQLTAQTPPIRERNEYVADQEAKMLITASVIEGTALLFAAAYVTKETTNTIIRVHEMLEAVNPISSRTLVELGVDMHKFLSRGHRSEMLEELLSGGSAAGLDEERRRVAESRIFGIGVAVAYLLGNSLKVEQTVRELFDQSDMIVSRLEQMRESEIRNSMARLGMIIAKERRMYS
ncbi:MAG: hypothetical protein KGH61_04830 [Candidatus Micrarchaeota archaeon]|nr:hypothetical protein [Candidatus Micrarchaeota archaeon]MDE1848242.1 hypothetical protein [Candidatus Micrarchaeota archaeon]MDE1864904.1 hypothetical protein [Candidatus Micrarchaeota archaeon]